MPYSSTRILLLLNGYSIDGAYAAGNYVEFNTTAIAIAESLYKIQVDVARNTAWLFIRYSVLVVNEPSYTSDPHRHLSAGTVNLSDSGGIVISFPS